MDTETRDALGMFADALLICLGAFALATGVPLLAAACFIGILVIA